MGNGASSTTRVVSVRRDPHFGKSSDEGVIPSRPSSSRASSAATRAHTPATIRTHTPAVFLPGAAEPSQEFGHDSKSESFKQSTTAKSAFSADLSETTHLRERVLLLEQKIAEHDRFLESHVFFSRSETLEQQWSFIQSETARLKSLGFKCQDPNQSNFEQTCNAQAQLIQRLERDLSTSKEDSVKLREKCERRLKREKSNSAKKAAEISLQIYELKEQIARLSDANTLLERELTCVNARLESSSDHTTVSRPATARPKSRGEERDDEDDAGGGDHTMLVLELSTRISDLTDELEAAQATIAQLSRGRPA